jgi:uncharacterized membrane protein YadS
MPSKLKVLIGLLAVSIVLAVVSQSWFVVGLNALLLIGVLKGNEGVRTLLIGLGFLGICGNAAIMILAAMVGTAGNDLIALVVMATGVFGIFQSGFFIWCLRQADVQSWMFRKTMGMDVAD